MMDHILMKLVMGLFGDRQVMSGLWAHENER